MWFDILSNMWGHSQRTGLLDEHNKRKNNVWKNNVFGSTLRIAILSYNLWPIWKFVQKYSYVWTLLLYWNLSIVKLELVTLVCISHTIFSLLKVFVCSGQGSKWLLRSRALRGENCDTLFTCVLDRLAICIHFVVKFV